MYSNFCIVWSVFGIVSLSFLQDLLLILIGQITEIPPLNQFRFAPTYNITKLLFYCRNIFSRWGFDAICMCLLEAEVYWTTQRMLLF